MAELFENIEINRQPRWPILGKLVVGSLVLHALFVMAVLYIPSVRAAFTIAQAFSNVGYVDEAYEKTRIADRAVMLSLNGGKFTYPPGYFGVSSGPSGPVANAKPKPPEAKIISEYKKELERKAEPTPTPAPSPLKAPVGEAVAEALSNANTKESANKALDQIAASNNVERPEENKINKKPLKDWLASADKLRLSGKLDLTKAVDIVIVADRDPDGVLRNVQVIQKDGDPKLVEVAKDLAAAISSSKVLYFLTDTKHLRLTMRLDSTDVTAKVESDVGSEDRADTLARTYAGFLLGGQLMKKGQAEETIYKAAKVKSEGKQVVVNFAMSRETATGILKKLTPEQSPAG